MSKIQCKASSWYRINTQTIYSRLMHRSYWKCKILHNYVYMCTRHACSISVCIFAKFFLLAKLFVLCKSSHYGSTWLLTLISPCDVCGRVCKGTGSTYPADIEHSGCDHWNTTTTVSGMRLLLYIRFIVFVPSIHPVTTWL